MLNQHFGNLKLWNLCAGNLPVSFLAKTSTEFILSVVIVLAADIEIEEEDREAVENMP